MSDEAKAIAEGLSELAARDLVDGNCVKDGNDCCLCDSGHLRELIRRELVRTDGFAVFRTQIGLAVRRHLQDQSQ